MRKIRSAAFAAALAFGLAGCSDAPDALAGDALPNWLKDNYPEQTDIDGVTGASTQRSIVFSRDISTDAGAKRYIRLRFEIDRSWNDNDWFWDRPAFTYATELIDLEDLQDSYRIILSGWMSNGSTGESIGQQPKKPIPSFTPYLFMEEETYLAPYGDMVTAGKIVISEN